MRVAIALRWMLCLVFLAGGISTLAVGRDSAENDLYDRNREGTDFGDYVPRSLRSYPEHPKRTDSRKSWEWKTREREDRRLMDSGRSNSYRNY